MKGLNNLDKALVLNPAYEDAMTYKDLFVPRKARLWVKLKRNLQYAQADEWFNKALETRKRIPRRQRARRNLLWIVSNVCKAKKPEVKPEVD